MKKYTLTRDGKRPLTFTGESIAKANNRSLQGARQNRWDAVEVYRTESGRIVVEQVYHTCYQGESDTHTVMVFDDTSAAITYLEQGVSSLAAEIAASLNVAEEI